LAWYGHHQSPAIRAGELIFCSGMVAINPESGKRDLGDRKIGAVAAARVSQRRPFSRAIFS
jgi:hypothetical protein